MSAYRRSVNRRTAANAVLGLLSARHEVHSIDLFENTR